MILVIILFLFFISWIFTRRLLDEFLFFSLVCIYFDLQKQFSILLSLNLIYFSPYLKEQEVYFTYFLYRTIDSSSLFYPQFSVILLICLLALIFHYLLVLCYYWFFKVGLMEANILIWSSIVYILAHSSKDSSWNFGEDLANQVSTSFPKVCINTWNFFEVIAFQRIVLAIKILFNNKPLHISYQTMLIILVLIVNSSNNDDFDIRMFLMKLLCCLMKALIFLLF